MSEERVELARRLFEALNHGDLPAVMEEMTPEFVFDFSRSRSPERGVYGRNELPAFREALIGIWDSVRFEPEFIEAGDQLVTPITSQNRGRDGIELRTETAWLWSFSDQGIERITFFQSRREALEAAGLSEQAMSEENLETARQGVEAINRMDVAAIVGMCDPDIEWKTELIGTPIYRGHEGIRQALRDIDRAWDSWHTEPVELLEADEMVFIATRAAARARGTGIPVEADLFYVATFRGGKIVQFDGFSDRSKARKAAGLSEQAHYRFGREAVVDAPLAVKKFKMFP